MISKRDKLRKIFLNTKSATSETEFRKYRTFVQNKIIKTKKEYFRNKCEKAKNSTDVWKVYRELLNIRKKKAQNINGMESEGTVTEDKNRICELLAAQFALPGKSNDEDIKNFKSSLDIKDLDNLFKDDKEVIESFHSLKSKSCTNSKVPYAFYSATIQTLAPTLKYLFNDFIMKGSLPGTFNQAIVTPIYKNKGSRTDPGNYRPVSNLPLLSKILEKGVYKKLSIFVEDKQLLDTHQHGFRKGRSCFTAASLFSHDILSNISKPHVKCLAMFVDLRKAFDSICTFKLLKKLLELGIDPRIIMYLCAYFTNRTFVIKLGDFLSMIFRLFKGCPQGGILSPILFALFYNEVGSALLQALYKLFADDLVFYIFSSNTADLIREASEILVSLNNWCELQDLSINFEKTKYVIFHKVQNKVEDDLPEIKCNGQLIERVPVFKYLGVHFDSTLTFQNHFEHVLSKVSSSVGCLMHIKRFLGLQTFKILVNSFIFSHIDYCFPIWGHQSDTNIQILQSRLNSILGAYFFPQIVNKYQKLKKINHISNKKKFKEIKIDYPELWECCNLLSVSERLKYFSSIIAFQAIRTPTIPEISNIFIPGRSARSQNMLILDHEGSLLEKSAFYQAIKVWNSLNSDAKKVDVSLESFKVLIDAWLLDKRESEFVCS